MAILAVLVLLALAAGTYYRVVLQPRTTVLSITPAAAPPQDVGAPSATSASMTTPAPADPPASPAPDPPVTAAPMPTGVVPRVDPWAAVRQFSAAGRYDRAIAAIDQVKDMPAALMQEERSRIVENARRYTLAARRGADDLLLTRSPHYAEGTKMQEEADRHRTDGRLTAAVGRYMAARAHFLQAFNDSGKAAPTGVVAAPAVSAPAAGPPPPAQAPAPAASTVDLSTWSNEEARASIAQFCGAYLARDMGGLNRIWPNMGPEWRAELREAFGTTGELVCVFENVVIVRTSDDFSVSARLLTQLPGGEQRRRALLLSLVPARDHLVIGNIRVR